LAASAARPPLSKALAETLARDDPKRVTSVMRKENRKGKVYIDWNQNDRSRTMVCAYSLRAEASPGISWPVDLSKTPDQVPIAENVSLPTIDPMHDLNRLRQCLPPV
jgi:DNA primase